MADGLIAYGVYVPRFRVRREDIARVWGGRGRGENSVALANEDVITMATEAAANAVRQAAIDPATEIDAVYLATSSSPYIEHSLVGIIAETLNVRPEADLAEFVSSPRAGSIAMRACLDAVRAERIRCGLVISSDSRPFSPGSSEEMTFGAGAAAWLVGSVDPVVEIEAMQTYATHFFDSRRQAGDAGVSTYEPRFTREFGYARHVRRAAQGLMQQTGRAPDEFRHVVFQQYGDERVIKEVAKDLGFRPEQLERGIVGQSFGDTGAASVFLGLAAVFDQAQPGERILALSYGAGGCDAFSLTITEQISDIRTSIRSLGRYLDSKEYVDYVAFAKMTGHLNKAEELAKLGVSPLSPMFWREGPDARQLTGAKCQHCGYVNFPPSMRKICIKCGHTNFQLIPLSRTGRVHTFAVNIYNPPGMESPLPIIVATLDDGTRIMAPGTEMTLQQVQIDMPVELVLRKLAAEDGGCLYTSVFRPPR